MYRNDGDPQRIDEFMSWLRRVTQSLDATSPVMILSGSIGLAPLMIRLGMPDRINHLYPFHVGPWDHDTSLACFRKLCESNQLSVESKVPDAVYEKLGVGVPHHIQTFFAFLKDFATMQNKASVNVDDVDMVYRDFLLGPSGQSSLAHYEKRLEEALDDMSFKIAMEILDESATQGSFTVRARHCLTELYTPIDDNAETLITEVLDILVHDGYLESTNDGYQFISLLLKDWFAARFRHQPPLRARRNSVGTGGESK